MKREIKFRVWDVELHMWINNIGMGKDNTLTKGTEKRFHVMQYTGLKDKKGTEIYEGDIVKINEANREYVVKFDNGCFKLFHNSYKLNGMLWGTLERVSELLWTMDVVGNIYDNPDLIEVAQV